MQVAVCGPAACTDDEARAAFAVGRHLARRGVTLLCGGGTGVMASAAAGAGSLHGLVVAIRPDADPSAPTGASASPAVPYLVVIRTGLGQARNAVLVASADAVIVVGGSWGTLSEFGFAQRRALAHPFPIVSLGGWQVLDGNGEPVPGQHSARDPEHAVALALGDDPKESPSPRS